MRTDSVPTMLPGGKCLRCLFAEAQDGGRRVTRPGCGGPSQARMGHVTPRPLPLPPNPATRQGSHVLIKIVLFIEPDSAPTFEPSQPQGGPETRRWSPSSEAAAAAVGWPRGLMRAVCLLVSPTELPEALPPLRTMFNAEPGPASAAGARNVVRSSSISGEICGSQQAGGGAGTAAAKKRRSSLGAKMVAIVGLTQWSKSALQLPQPGEGVQGTGGCGGGGRLLPGSCPRGCTRPYPQALR